MSQRYEFCVGNKEHVAKMCCKNTCKATYPKGDGGRTKKRKKAKSNKSPSNNKSADVGMKPNPNPYPNPYTYPPTYSPTYYYYPTKSPVVNFENDYYDYYYYDDYYNDDTI